MKTNRFIILMILLSTICIAQQNTFNKEAELQKFVERGGKVEETSPNIYRLTYRTGESRTFNFGSKADVNESNEPVDTTIINIWEIDTTKYADRFTFWQRVEMDNGVFYPVFVEDLNRNGRPEMYGYHHSTFPPEGPVEIYERDSLEFFNSLFAYPDPSTILVKAMGEIHGSGEKEIYIHHWTIPNGVVYKSDTVGALPTTFDFVFYYTPNQINDMMFGDFDQNEINECVFVDMNTPSKIIIGEFREEINNFITTFEYSTGFDTPSGFATSDYDQDGKIEFAIGTGDGNMLIIENVDINNYELVWQNPFSTYNAYMQTATDDIDGNGKSEFWIGGQDFVNGITRFQCYETNGKNSYEQVAMIELRYINSFDANNIMAKDIDSDGKEEIIISIGNVILMLKFIGSFNSHQYEIYYVKIGEATEPTVDFEPIALSDLDGDSKIDILLPFYKYENNHPIDFSYILRQNCTTGIVNSKFANESVQDSLVIFPSPFNSTTHVKYFVTSNGPVKIKIFNILGKEIATLLDEKLSPGEYSIDWDAKDKYGSPFPSGVYFISLQTEKVLKTIKTILLK